MWPGTRINVVELRARSDKSVRPRHSLGISEPHEASSGLLENIILMTLQSFTTKKKSYHMNNYDYRKSTIENVFIFLSLMNSDLNILRSI